MRLRRATAILAFSLVLTASACGVLRRGESATPNPIPTDPRAALTASVAHFATTSFKCTMKDAESTGTCLVDPKAKNAKLDLTFTAAELGLEMVFNLLVKGEDTWLKVDFGRATGNPRLPKLPPGWMHLDPNKIEDSDTLSFDNEDPTGATHVIDAIVDVQLAGERQYKGTVDLTKATESAIVNDDHVKALGDQAKAMPFQATLDDKGRLASLTIPVPAAGDDEAQTWEATYLDYGVPVEVQSPAGDVVEAPDDAYQIFT